MSDWFRDIGNLQHYTCNNFDNVGYIKIFIVQIRTPPSHGEVPKDVDFIAVSISKDTNFGTGLLIIRTPAEISAL